MSLALFFPPPHTEYKYRSAIKQHIDFPKLWRWEPMYQPVAMVVHRVRLPQQQWVRLHAP